MENQEEKRMLPQNLRDLLKDIGESSVLFQIYTKIYSTDWQAFKNLSHAGCDIVLLNLTINKIIKVEVKTRQSLYTTASSKNTLNQIEFSVTNNEYNEMDLLIAYWYDYNAHFVIPKISLKKSKNKYKMKINLNNDGSFGSKSIYLNNWEPLLNLIATTN